MSFIKGFLITSLVTAVIVVFQITIINTVNYSNRPIVYEYVRAEWGVNGNEAVQLNKYPGWELMSYLVDPKTKCTWGVILRRPVK
jgi:hypothetical protein